MNTIIDPDGEVRSIAEWARLNGRNETTVYRRWCEGERDIWRLVREPEKSGRRNDLDIPQGKPELTDEQKKELIKLAKYSEGQKDRGRILCDFVPCQRVYASWLLKELGLDE